MEIVFSMQLRQHCKQGFFALQTRLLYNANKASLECKEALFWNWTNLMPTCVIVLMILAYGHND